MLRLLSYTTTVWVLIFGLHACSAYSPAPPLPYSPSAPVAPVSPLEKPPSTEENKPVKVSLPQHILLPSTTTKLEPIVPSVVNVTTAVEKLTIGYHQQKSQGLTLSMVSFDDRNQHFRVADQTNGPGSRWNTAQTAAKSVGGVAAINAGFFTPEGNPLGIVIENGTKRGSLNTSSLGAGMISFSGSNASIFRRQSYSASRHSSGNLIQTGPMLAERNKTISGLSKTNSRRRSFIAWDGGHYWIMGYTSPCSLNTLSQAISGKTLAGVKVHTAINLDGGRSSDLWVGSSIKNGGKTHRTFINKPVRNYLVLVNNR